MEENISTVAIPDMPKVAIVGRPNVGKSTLINRICRIREAIVHREPMITRDRKYYTAEWNGKLFYIIDTGGIDLKSGERLSLQIFLQAKKAIDEADVVVFMVDLREPLSPMDEEIVDILRKSNKKIILVGNKWDSEKGNYYTDDFLKLGLGYPIKISAMHGINIGDLLDEIVADFSNSCEGSKPPEENLPCISILGKPNVGKSTLFNVIVKEERAIVDEVEGTTRDTIDSIVNINDRLYKFIDTAGLKKDRRKEEDLEYYSKLRTIRAIEKSDVCLILVDSTEAVTKQDLKIVDICLEKGASVCIILNKIDLVEKKEIDRIVEDLDKKLDFARFVPFLKASALKEIGIPDIFEMIDLLIKERTKKVPESRLIPMFKELEQTNPIYVKERKFKLKFMKQIGISPPTFLIFSN
ncbi:MAG: ribosome biogenesis GTPase Der, partial [Actinobacteria bacterium]|nr:ribosome biogenesis GTPase Der [Actinomycetota bacterium]